MKNPHQERKFMNTIVFKIVVLLTSIHLLASCASGTALVTGTPRDPITPDMVKIYLNAPSSYEVIAIVKAESDAGWTAQGSQDYAVEELKKQAAKVGANGVLLGATGQKTSTVVGGGYSYGSGYAPIYAIPVDSETVSGEAIYVFSE